MRIAIPLLAESLLSHFGDAHEFALYDVDNDTKAVTALGVRAVSAEINAAHGGGCHALPPALKEWGVELVLVHDIGRPAINDLLLHGILAVTDVPQEEPDLIMQKLVKGQLLAQHPSCVAAGEDPRGKACGNCTHHGRKE
ncbi:MAG: NifB/NifX family molybdenum-iron cluster-binding protein [Phycisphaerae bacterium]